MAKEQRPNARRLVLLLWILVAFFYFYLSYDYIRVSMSDRELGDYLQYVVQLAGAEKRPAKELRTLILVKSEELGLPITGDKIAISGDGNNLRVSLGYEVDIQVPVFERGVYRKYFEHSVAYRPLN